MCDATPKEIVDEVRRHGGDVWIDNNDLAYRLPADLNRHAWVRLFARQKHGLVAYLAEQLGGHG